MKRNSFVLFLLIIATALSAQQKNLTYNFDFGSGNVEDNYIQVNDNSQFNYASGYGFDFNTTAKSISTKGKNKLTSDYCTSGSPFYFSVALPDGNYKVTITLGNKMLPTNNTIKAEARRLMVHNLETKAGEFTTVTFNVNVHNPMLPSGKSVRLKSAELDGHPSWDNRLTLEFNGENPSVCAISVERVGDVTTVYICGDSTVCDQSKEPWSGWGMMLPYFFDHNICVANFAQSGETLRAFQGEKRLEKVLSVIGKGDYMFIQFGHNDMKPGAKTPAQTLYKELLLEYAIAAREKGAIPVFVTSMNRRAFDENGKIINTLEDYPDAVKAVGKENNIPVIDLHAMSKILYETLGVEGTKKAFVHYPAGTFPGQDVALEDNSHFNSYGAIQLTKCVVEGMRKNNLELIQHLKPEIGSYDPSKPDNFDAFNVPVSPVFDTEKPEGN